MASGEVFRDEQREGAPPDWVAGRSGSEALQDALQYLNTVVGSSHDGIFVVDAEGRFEYGNEAFFRILGWPREELLGEHFIKAIPPDYHEFILRRWQEVQAGRGEPYETDIVQKDGTRRSLAVSHRHMTIAGQRKYCVVIKDITEKKRAEAALRRSERRFRAIFDQAFQLVGLLSPDGTLLEANRTALDFAGVKAEDVIGRPFWETPWWTHSRQQQEIIRDAVRRAAAGETVRLETQHPGPDGQIRYIDGSLKPVFDADGRVELLIPEGRDITERKLVEEQLALHRDRLGELVAQRTAELKAAQEALREAHGRLLTVREGERRQLARDLHDSIGQSLVALKMQLQELRGPGGTALEGSAAAAVRRAMALCVETIRELRAISHGLYPPALESMGLAAALRQLGRSCGAGVSVRVECDPALQEARFAPEREIALFRIAQEAVSNALRHGRAGSIRIHLARRDGHVALSVIDDGVGFDPSAVGPGGMGLFSMESRAERIGGTLRVTSRAGRTEVTAAVPEAVGE